jgi:hypothetical protein
MAVAEGLQVAMVAVAPLAQESLTGGVDAPWMPVQCRAPCPVSHQRR